MRNGSQLASARNLAGLLVLLLAAAAYVYKNPGVLGLVRAAAGPAVEIVRPERFAEFKAICAKEQFKAACLSRLVRRAARRSPGLTTPGHMPIRSGEQMRSAAPVVPAGRPQGAGFCRKGAADCDVRRNESAEGKWDEPTVPEITTVAVEVAGPG